MNYFKKLALLTILSITFFSCGDDDSSSTTQGTSQISVKLMDAPGDFEHVYVEVVDVMVKVNDDSDDDSGWQSLNAINTGTYDLLDLTGGVNVLLVDDFEVLAGTLNQIRLVLGDDNTVVIDGETFPLNTPSAQQSGLKIQVNQTLLPNVGYTFLLDFDVDESIVIAGNSGNINLRPVIRANVEAVTGIISGSVLPLGVQTEITATNGIDTVSSYADADGNFVLVGLTPGIYTVTVTPDPLSGFSSFVIENVEVTVENNTTLGAITLE
ncbi:DUF4382 domain-containing protein [Subsaxibacter sp. CAU 1640]|uniref:DUF4382 domain-containing protein n=1 Tax=Subsaxibacter sp. CAU 1640 TaxID=2933271 RepID=UPI0020049B00|nr:DUF4382 domain-containing protein [Subsaxibacter sp. CAU 1640]MCK7589337.1 DUF4382 domain-containing protein [Subsaxibacter sp. CAU 1640]